VQALDLLGLQRNSCISPAEADVGVVAFFFCQIANTLDESKCLSEVLNLNVRSILQSSSRMIQSGV